MSDNQRMHISDEAVEAAAYALYLDANPESEVQWFDISFHEQDELIRRVRPILAAAAPHLMAEADEGCCCGTCGL